ncbi:MAG TPA: terpene cyclase/mutase family protein [Phycisphaerae bacterium]|nr:terpene cyclase/mutase family protein [Phycisphaerales bacterium]HRX84707.1 terpene cyclase/mutase family protein [Phycisphaerae bacterium]
MMPHTLVMVLALWASQPGGASAPAPGGLLPKYITPETDAAIDRGLAWLARNQGRDGAWRNRSGYGTYPVAMSALAGLAFLSAGNTTTQGKYAPNVDRVTEFLLNCRTSSGLIARMDEADGRPMYGHGFATLFLAELYGMTEDADRQAQIRAALEGAVELTARSQSPLGGWIYMPDGGSDEGSVTITQLQALRACRNAGIAVPKETIDRALKYLEMSFRSDGGIAYRARQAGPSRPPITAAAVCCWFNCGDYDNPLAKRCLQFCHDTLGRGEGFLGHEYYANLYYSQAIYLSDEPARWDIYFPKYRDKLLREQKADGSWMGDAVGLPYGTALAAIILQLPYNRLPIMQR